MGQRMRACKDLEEIEQFIVESNLEPFNPGYRLSEARVSILIEKKLARYSLKDALDLLVREPQRRSP